MADDLEICGLGNELGDIFWIDDLEDFPGENLEAFAVLERNVLRPGLDTLFEIDFEAH